MFGLEILLRRRLMPLYDTTKTFIGAWKSFVEQ